MKTRKLYLTLFLVCSITDIPGNCNDSGITCPSNHLEILSTFGIKTDSEREKILQTNGTEGLHGKSDFPSFITHMNYLLKDSIGFLKPGSDWDHLVYLPYSPIPLGLYNGENKRLYDWFDLYASCLLNGSPSIETDLNHKVVSCSFNIRDHGNLGNLTITHSSGSEKIDGMALAIIRRANLRSIPPPPNTAPFYGITVTFNDQKLCSILLKPHSEPSPIDGRLDLMYDNRYLDAPFNGVCKVPARKPFVSIPDQPKDQYPALPSNPDFDWTKDLRTYK